MKAKNVFLSIGLSLVMGAAVAASGAISMAKEMKPAHAGNNVTLYLEFSGLSWWGSDNAELYAHCWGGSAPSTTWPGAAMSPVAGSSTRYSVEIDDGYTNVIFTRVNPADHTTVWNRSSKADGTAINLPSDYTVNNQWNLIADGSGYDDGNYTGTWSLYTPPAVTHQVNVYVDGVLVGGAAQTIGDGELPEAPALTDYGKGFDGWYSDASCTGAKVTEITSDTSVYGKTYKLPEWSYKIDSFPVSSIFTDVYVYAFESNGRKNASWPGVEYDGSSFIVPNDATIVINNGDGAQTVDIEQSHAANDILRLSSEQDSSNKYLANWKSDLDEPDVEGYYISGEFSSNPCWTYDDSEQMTNTTGDNVAYEMNFNLAVGDEMRVRSFYLDRYPYNQWATLGDNGYASQADPADNWGEQSGDNFKATKAGYYDVYAKYEDHDSDGIKEAFMFYVAPHVDTYEISLTAKIYEGRTLVETRNLASQLAYDGSDFNPVFDTIEGYTSYGVFTDAACSTEYVPHAFNAAGQLYLQYMRTGYYVVGDADFTGSNIGAWAPHGGVRLTTECQDPANFLEGAIIIPDVEGAVQVRPLLLNNDGTIDWVDYSLGATYSFASKNGNNIDFSESGTYGVYVKIEAGQAVVYLNKGLEAFYTKFLGEVGGVCSGILDGTKNLDNLKNVWLDQKAAYESLSAAEKATISGITGGIDGGDEEGSRLEQVVAKYSYIVHKYGTANCEDFVWGGTYAASSQSLINVARNNTMLIVAISATVVILSAGLTILLIKRRKEA